MTQGHWRRAAPGLARVEGTGMAQSDYDEHGRGFGRPQAGGGAAHGGHPRAGHQPAHQGGHQAGHQPGGYPQQPGYPQQAGYPNEAYGQYPAARPVSRGQRIINIIGAVGSVALVLSLGWWGWDLAVRDARGVPVIRALEGPMRVAPEDPGGQVVDHQGLSVNSVAAAGGAGPASDHLVLAPPPVELTLEDGPGLGVLQGMATPGGAANVVPPTSDPMANMPAQLADPEIPVTPDVNEPDAVALALAEALGLEPEAIPATPPAAAGEMQKSLRPKPRPSATAANVTQPAAVPVTPNMIDPASLAPGTRLVQFGAYNSREDAEAEWSLLARRFADLMAGKSMIVQAAESGGQTFWRLRAHGFENEQESRRFCVAFEAEGAKCIPVAHR